MRQTKTGKLDYRRQPSPAAAFGVLKANSSRWKASYPPMSATQAAPPSHQPIKAFAVAVPGTQKRWKSSLTLPRSAIWTFSSVFLTCTTQQTPEIPTVVSTEQQFSIIRPTRSRRASVCAANPGLLWAGRHDPNRPGSDVFPR